MVEHANRAGQCPGNYRLIRLLGRGGFAEVYLAEHIHLNTQAAVKILRTQLANEEIEGFRNEARMIAGLIDPHIVRVLDFGIENGVPYLVMDYAPHGTLRQRHPRGARLPLQLVVSHVQQIASALHYAHDQRLIHRDVKPENMLVGRKQEILLSDFGIALVAQSSQYQQTQNIAGTLAYMAPEQIQAHPRPASDQYSLGIVVYEWLAGQRPFQGTMTEIAIKHATAAPPPLRLLAPDVPPAVEQVVLTALQKDPHSRFPTIQAFARALEHASSQHARGTMTLEAPTTRLPLVQPPGLLQRPVPPPYPQAGSLTPVFSHEAQTDQVQSSQSPSGPAQSPGSTSAQPMSQAGGQPGSASASSFRASFFVWPLVLLVLIGAIAVLLFEGQLGFPGFFFWFIGGDLTQLWFLVLVVLGFLYRRTLVRLWKRAAEEREMRHSQAFSSEYPALAHRRSSGTFIQGLLHVPLVLLVGFLVYYFFIVGYTFHVGPHLTVTGDCNGGTLTVQGRADNGAVSLQAGLLTMEGSGNYEGVTHVLTVSSNLCGLTLEVPAATNLHLSGNNATLWVRGITGKVELDDNAGDITIDGSTLLAGSVVSTNAGRITISNSCLTPGVKVGSNGSAVTQHQVKPCH